jgi:hypothetical protein
MRLITIQSIEAYDYLFNHKELITDGNSPLFNRDFLDAYKWMSSKMKDRNCIAREKEIYPLWAWKSWEGKSLVADLDFYINSENKYVLLTIELEEDEFLLSDFDLFHYVLNYWYLPENEKDEENFENEYKSHGYTWDDLSNFEIEDSNMIEIRKKIEDSWDRIFDIAKEDENLYYGKLEDKSIQACFWRLSIDQVVDVKYI